MKMLKLFFCALIFLFYQVAFAISSTPVVPTDNFDINAANQRLLQYNSEFARRPTNIRQLENTITELTQLRTQAKKCVDTTQLELNSVNAQLQTILPKNGVTSAPSAEQTYLESKRAQLSARLSDCRLFLLRSQETSNNYNTLAHELATRQLLTAEPDVIAKFTANINLLEQLPQQFNPILFMELSGIEQLNVVTLTIFFILIVIAITIAIKLRAILSRYIVDKTKETYLSRFLHSLFSVLKMYLLPLFILIAIVLFASILGLGLTPLPYITWISYGLLAYLIFMILMRLLFYPPEPAQPLTNLTPVIGRALVSRLRLLALLLVTSFIIYIVFRDQDFPLTTVYFARTVFISLLAIILISIIWLINRAPKVLYFHPAVRSLLSFVLAASLMIILLIEWLGYHGIAIYLLKGISFTLLVGFIAWAVQKILIHAVNALAENKRAWQQHLHAQLGIDPQEPIPELIWLRIFVYALVWSGLIIALLKIWGLSRIYFREIGDVFLTGFSIAHIQIVPLHLLFALLVFTFLIALTRLIRTRIGKSPRLATAPGAREALATIASYTGFALALLIALIIAGVNFAGLAIIAGALSVGIGFGLQNIVNNFVSGIILLIERPIKPGDRIIVGGTEGYVKKISIRFTQLETSHKSDVIVPNAELISQQVTNLMYRDHYSRITIPITLAYNSDVELAKKVLLNIANNHPAVITDYPANDPRVDVKQFSQSGLELELSCLIRNVNEQGSVKTDLYFAIEKVFREQNIAFGFPQQDIHIRDWPEREE